MTPKFMLMNDYIYGYMIIYIFIFGYSFDLLKFFQILDIII